MKVAKLILVRSRPTAKRVGAGSPSSRHLSETCISFGPLSEHKEHTKHEAKEHDLPLVRQGRA
jgi:hypothetical protein